MSKLLLKINNLLEGTVLKRPSKYIKTPYVADVIPIENADSVLAHSAALGCCGLCEVGASILMSPIETKKKNDEKLHCEYRIYLSILREKNKEIIIGVYPKLAEDLTEQALKHNHLSILTNVKSYRRETVIYLEGKIDSRFDFSGIDSNNVPFIMEVKNVPLADYEDIDSKERKKKSYDDRDVDSKIAYFPDGYRKTKNEPVSPRALKHIRELTMIKKMSKTRCIMCYVIQRDDANRFQPSIIDPEYRNAVKIALESGVEIITMVVKWTRDGEAYLLTDCLPITQFE